MDPPEASRTIPDTPAVCAIKAHGSANIVHAASFNRYLLVAPSSSANYSKNGLIPKKPVRASTSKPRPQK
ncbi:hypothetical protein F183_A30480 [Bryobacterales bacterium F-183]|nr:hypothetical protein F183_A30480 [Bryobacterales bacterium F-183]